MGDLVYYPSKNGEGKHYGIVTEMLDLTDKCRIYWYHIRSEQLHRKQISDVSSLVIVEEEDEV